LYESPFPEVFMTIPVRPMIFLFIATLSFAQTVLAAKTEAVASGKTAVTSVKAVLAPTEGNAVSGVVSFTQMANGIKIVADVSGLTPGEHGFHVHEWGDCSAPDAMSAGSHFNPSDEPHGAPDALHHHAGDFGNLIADAAGKAHYEWIAHNISLSGMHSIVGRGMIVHAKRDDLHSQPVGDAGARVACGVIGVVKP